MRASAAATSGRCRRVCAADNTKQRTVPTDARSRAAELADLFIIIFI